MKETGVPGESHWPAIKLLRASPSLRPQYYGVKAKPGWLRMSNCQNYMSFCGIFYIADNWGYNSTHFYQYIFIFGENVAV